MRSTRAVPCGWSSSQTRLIARRHVRSSHLVAAPRAAARARRDPGFRVDAWCSSPTPLTLPIAMGQAAMFVFFALSGFLITALLLEERATTGRVSLANFFARRALRLLPALVFFLAGWLAVVLATGGHAPWTTTVPGGTAGAGTSPWAALEGAGGRPLLRLELGRHRALVHVVRPARATCGPSRWRSSSTCSGRPSSSCSSHAGAGWRWAGWRRRPRSPPSSTSRCGAGTGSRSPST